VGRALKISIALNYAFMGAFALLIYLHVMLDPSVAEIERLLHWAPLEWVPFSLATVFLTPSREDDSRFEMTPALIGAIVVVVGGVAALVALGWGLIPKGFDTPLMVAPFCLVVAASAAWFASRNSNRFGEARFAASDGDGPTICL